MVLISFYNIDGELASQKSSDPEVMALVHWLKSIPVDQDTIDKVNSMKPRLVSLSLSVSLFRGRSIILIHIHPLLIHTCVILFSSCSLMSSPWTVSSTWPQGMIWHIVE